MKRWNLLTIILLLTLAACRTAAPSPTGTPIPPTDTAVPQPTDTIAATAVPAESATTPDASPESIEASGFDPATSPIFDLAWDDRTIFEPSLVPAARDVLDELPGATVYHIAVSIGDDLVTLVGREAIRYTNREDVPLDDLRLRLFPNLASGRSEISSARVDGQAVTPALELQESVVRLPLDAPLQPGQTAVIEIDFDVTVPTEEGGNYGEFLNFDDVLALAHFYPMVAVYDDEGWNVEIAPPSGDVVYNEASFYVVEVDAPASLTLAASGVAIEEETSGARQRVRYVIGPARDFYLVGSGRYERLTETVGQTTINSYAFDEYDEARAFVLSVTGDAMATFNEQIGLYPYTEFDVVGTHTRALGIEYPGIVVDTQRVYDFSEDPDFRPILESTTAHEVAHQWFYNVIGNDQLDEPWLDEALAQYATYLYYVDQYGEGNAQGFFATFDGRWDRVEGEEIPIGMPVRDYSGQEYGAIVYGRGPIFVAELAETMGEDAFDRFLKAYYQAFKWDVATTASFQALAETTCDCNLTALFEEWVYPE